MWTRIFKRFRSYTWMKNNRRRRKKELKKKEVILIKPYKVSSLMSLLTRSLSFVNKEVNNLLKYMKFIKFPTQTRIFQPPLYYQSLQSKGEQDSVFWKEIAIAMVESKHNIETSRNGHHINIFQGGSLHKPFFIAIDNQGQVIISPSKKIVAIYVVKELKVLVWFMETWMLKTGYCYNWYLKDTTWRRAKDNDDMIGCTEVVLVSTSYNRCSILTFSLYIMTHLPYRLQPVSLYYSYICSIDTILYSYALLLIHHP